MSQPNRPRAEHSQAGFTMAVILFMAVALTLVVTLAVHRVKGEVHSTGRDLRHIKAKAVAESAINWAQQALANPKDASQGTFMVATLDSTGKKALPDKLEGKPNPAKLQPNALVQVYAGETVEAKDGWISHTTKSSKKSLTDSDSETMSFKIWYPDSKTLRITGKGVVEGVQAQVEMTGQLNL